MSDLIAALYIRVSTEDQANKGYSIPAQRRRLQEYCIANNIQIYKIYEDDCSGKLYEEREQLMKMLEDAEAHLFNCVVVIKVDRFARKLYGLLTIKERLDKANIKIFITDEAIDPSEDTGMVMFSMMGTFAEFERKRILDRMMTGKREIAKQGIKKRNGAILPFGYRYDETTKRFEPIEDKVGLIKSIYNMYLNGASYTGIAKYLQSIGYETAERLPRRILHNPVYKGYVAISYYDNVVPQSKKPKYEPIVTKAVNVTPIIDEETWDAVQKREKYVFNAKKKVSDDFYLKDVIKCYGCGNSLRTFHSKNKYGTEYKFYSCNSSKIPHHYRNVCEVNHNWQRDIIHDEFKAFIKSLKVNTTSLQKINNNQLKEVQERIKSIESSLNKKNKQKSVLLEKLSLELISDNDYLTATNQLAKDITLLQTELLNLQESERSITDSTQFEDNLYNTISNLKSLLKSWDTIPNVKKRAIIDECIDKIYIWDYKIVKIEFKA